MVCIYNSRQSKRAKIHHRRSGLYVNTTLEPSKCTKIFWDVYESILTRIPPSAGKLSGFVPYFDGVEDEGYVAFWLMRQKKGVSLLDFDPNGRFHMLMEYIRIM